MIDKENIDTSRLYIDGTKIESRANKYTFVWRGRVEKSRENLYKKITTLFNKKNQKYDYENLYFPVYERYEETQISLAILFIEREIEKE